MTVQNWAMASRKLGRRIDVARFGNNRVWCQSCRCRLACGGRPFEHDDHAVSLAA